MHDAITLGFLRQRVTVRADAAELIAILARRFKMMVVPDHSGPGAQISVTRHGDAFFLDVANARYSYSDLLPQLEYHILDKLVQASPSFLWLHAGAVERDGQAILVSGSSGCGKSTMTLGLCERGWRYLSDDLVPVQMEGAGLYPFLRTPWFRLGNGAELPPGEIHLLDKREVELDGELIAKGPAALAMLIFPCYHHGAKLTFERMTGSPVVLNLAGQSVNFSAHGQAALTFLTDMVRRIPAFRIVYSKPLEAIGLIEDLWARRLSGTA